MNTNIIKTFTETLPDRSQEQCCNARDLHAFLEVGKDFSNWIKDRIQKYEFKEGEDFLVTTRSPDLATGERDEKGRFIGADAIDYHLTLDMAKELAMIENNPKGREVRRYFIQIENQARRRPVTQGLLSRIAPDTKEYRAVSKEARITFYATIQECCELRYMDMVSAWKMAGDIVRDIYGIDLLADLGNPHLTASVANLDKTTHRPRRTKEREPVLNWAQRTALRHALVDLSNTCRSTFPAHHMAYDWLVETMNVICEERIPASRYMEALNLVRVKKAQCLETESMVQQLSIARQALASLQAPEAA